MLDETVPQLPRCPRCSADWTLPAAYMQAWLPCRCAQPATGHRVQVCMACRSKSYDPDHVAPVLRLPVGAAGDKRDPLAVGGSARGSGETVAHDQISYQVFVS